MQRHLIYTLIRLTAKYVERKKAPRKDFSPDYTLLLFEEPEAFLHPTQQERLNAGLQSLGTEEDHQVIATTHSNECLQAACSAFDGLFEPEFRYIRLERIGEEIKAKTFTHEMLETALESDLEVR